MLWSSQVCTEQFNVLNCISPPAMPRFDPCSRSKPSFSGTLGQDQFCTCSRASLPSAGQLSFPTLARRASNGAVTNRRRRNVSVPRVKAFITLADSYRGAEQVQCCDCCRTVLAAYLQSTLLWDQCSLTVHDFVVHSGHEHFRSHVAPRQSYCHCVCNRHPKVHNSV